MKRTLLIIATFASLGSSMAAPSAAQIDSMIVKAEISYFELADFGKALRQYEAIQQYIGEDHTAYKYCIEKIASSLYFIQEQHMQEKENDNSIFYATQFIGYVEEHKEELEYRVYKQKYYMMRNLVVDHFALGLLEDARDFQDLLYQAYKDDELPAGLRSAYNFEMFQMGDNNVWGYEVFSQGDSTSGKFSKHKYFVYSTDWHHRDKDLLYILETSKVISAENNGRDFVLTRHDIGTDASKDVAYWNHTFASPVNYGNLRTAVKSAIEEEGKKRKVRN